MVINWALHWDIVVFVGVLVVDEGGSSSALHVLHLVIFDARALLELDLDV